MPAYFDKDGRVVCPFRGGQKFKMRYAILDFSDKSHLDNGLMWPTAFALKDLSAEVESEIASSVKRAVG